MPVQTTGTLVSERAGPIRSQVTTSERLFRARRISTTFGRIYLGAKANQFIERRLRPPDMAARWTEFHRTSAKSILGLALQLRGLILKGCQFMSARADVLPPEYVSILEKLQDRVPAKSFRIVRQTVSDELGRPLEEVFAEFDPVPIAAASLAQVHEARLHDGRRVAVKVQYPEIADLVRGDLANLRMLFRALGYLEPDFDLLPIVDELGAQIPRELDFENEGRNVEAIGALLAHRDDVVVPEIVWEHTRRRVLVMEFLEGVKITDVDGLRAAGVDPEWAARTLVDIFAEQILRHGHFHADPHPGNLLVDPTGPRLMLLDFGLTKELPDTFRAGVLGFVAALMQGDVDAMGAALADLGFELRDGQPEALRDVAELILRVGQEAREKGSLDPESLARVREEIPERVRQNPIVRIPHHLVLLGRTLGLLSGVSRSLGAQVDLFRVAVPYAFAPSPAAAPRPASPPAPEPGDSAAG
jgi:predicted unusual protein kinase regulating ubiquinone biosynthesis (AarF/ABC1/UbiB family)